MKKVIISLFAICSLPAANAAVLFEETFDTDTANLAEFDATYTNFDATSGNIFTSGGVAIATTSSVATILGFNSDVTYSMDVGAVNNNGAYNVGIQIGSNRIVFHPGFGGGALRVEGTGGFGNTNLGFTPANTTLHHLEISQDATTGVFDITFTDGDNAANSFATTFTNLAAVGQNVGITQTGGTASATGLFDNFKVETAAVPEPSSTALLGLGGLALLLRRKK